MGVTSSAKIRLAFIGGLATMGMCLVWMGANSASHHHISGSFASSLGQFEMPLPPTVAAAALPITMPTLSLPKFTAAEPLPVGRFVHYEGTIHGSLFEAAMAQGVPVAMLTEMIKIFSYDVDFQRDIQPDDRFELMFERGTDKRFNDAKLLYASMTLSGKEIKLYRYVDPEGNVDYYTPAGESAKKALLKTPVDGAKISSGFGMRFHPILHYTTQHKGIDFAVMTGTPVMAAGSGTVEVAGVNGSYGIYVRIKHDGSHETAYAHLSRLAKGIRPGSHVTQGQTIAYSGSTGRSTGPHLHYEVLVNESQVNPMSVKFQSGRKLTGKELAKFEAVEKKAAADLAETPRTTRSASR
jgi:murein DD-endopeptidase MepM/ murein hydrolase activator NlpD